MPTEIYPITLQLPFRLGSVNCYLIDTGAGYVLIDTGGSNQRSQLLDKLTGAGCRAGNLNLIVLTHGDFDHSGNAAYLRSRFATRIAMHVGDSGMAEHGDMFWNRKSGGALFRRLAPILFRFAKTDRFEPDLCLEDGCDLSEYGFSARVLEIPGHSSGSIGILTAGGDLFCGDLLSSTGKPGLNAIMDDPAAASASMERLRGQAINTVYPGHGKPFPIKLFISSAPPKD